MTALTDFTQDLKSLQTLQEDIIVYGASKLGWYAMQSLNSMGLSFACFADQSAQEGPYTYHNQDVIAPQALSSYKEKVILVAVFNPNLADQIARTLREDGQKVLKIDPYALLFYYFTSVAKRQVDRAQFAQSILNLKKLYAKGTYTYGHIEEGLFVSPFVTSNVTEKCNLKCIDCSQLIPYYDQPRNFNVDQVVADVKAYCEAYDLVPEVSLQGGDPFLNPQIGDICLALSEIPNLVFINLTTNGTLLPKEGNWEKFTRAGVDLHQSDYKKMSKRQNLIFDLCEDHQIYCGINFCLPSEKWVRNKIQDYGRGPEENDALFNKCISGKTCAHLLEGKLYRCAVAAHGAAQTRFLDQRGQDFVALRRDGKPNKDEIKIYMTKTQALSACNYCGVFEGDEVDPALQISPKNIREMEAIGKLNQTNFD